MPEETTGSTVPPRSKDRSGPHLAFGAKDWNAFVKGVKEGTFRLPD